MVAELRHAEAHRAEAEALRAVEVRMQATVASYEPAAEWDHFDDGTFSAYDKPTLKVFAPERHAGAMLSLPASIQTPAGLGVPNRRYPFDV